MKRLFLAFLITLTFSSCVKNVIIGIDEENNRKKIIGTWVLKRIEPLNNQSSYSGLDFLNGEFNFQINGILDFGTMAISESYHGTWVLRSIEQASNCSTAPDGSQVCIPRWKRLLDLDVLKVNSQQRKKASFESFAFQTDNYFTAIIYVGNSGYKYHFERK